MHKQKRTAEAVPLKHDLTIAFLTGRRILPDGVGNRKAICKSSGKLVTALIIRVSGMPTHPLKRNLVFCKKREKLLPKVYIEGG